MMEFLSLMISQGMCPSIQIVLDKVKSGEITHDDASVQISDIIKTYNQYCHTGRA